MTAQVFKLAKAALRNSYSHRAGCIQFVRYGDINDPDDFGFKVWQKNNDTRSFLATDIIVIMNALDLHTYLRIDTGLDKIVLRIF
jgi:hypothetical protein